MLCLLCVATTVCMTQAWLCFFRFLTSWSFTNGHRFHLWSHSKVTPSDDGGQAPAAAPVVTPGDHSKQDDSTTMAPTATLAPGAGAGATAEPTAAAAVEPMAEPVGAAMDGAKAHPLGLPPSGEAHTQEPKLLPQHTSEPKQEAALLRPTVIGSSGSSQAAHARDSADSDRDDSCADRLEHVVDRSAIASRGSQSSASTGGDSTSVAGDPRADEEEAPTQQRATTPDSVVVTSNHGSES